MKTLILDELHANPMRLLALNPSRRDSVLQHLERLASQPTSIENPSDLRRWIEGPRTQQQEGALRCYFEELALVTMGQAILLKAWSDRGLRSWSEPDLGRLNWALSTALKTHLPLDREGWVITRPNIYSWYNPSPSIQREIWASFRAWRFTDEGPGFLTSLLGVAKQNSSEGYEAQGYDSKFFESLWQRIASPASGFGSLDGVSCGPIKRKRTVFCPTLRDGAVVRTGPTSLNWIGTEEAPYPLMIAELIQLWWGPAAPPLWNLGSGLEVHTRDQLSLAFDQNQGRPAIRETLNTSTKASLNARIADMEAADLAYVLEERPTRSQDRSRESLKFRELVQSLPYFKKLKAPGTSLGMLQSCVALSKLRPDGMLWWAREEALSPLEGSEALNFVLERAKIVAEWDLSLLTHSLPGKLPLFPKYLYLMKREPDLHERMAHRPLKISVSGQIRSHVEVPLVLADLLRAGDAHLRKENQTTRAHWSIQVHQSPTPQHEWADRWPAPVEAALVRRLDSLRHMSAPLASSTTIRPTPPGDPAKGHTWAIHESLRGLWIEAAFGDEGRKLVTHELPRVSGITNGSGFMILLPSEAWVAPLRSYLESRIVQEWLDQNAERKNERWVLTEQIVKWIPVPKTLMKWLGSGDGSPSFATPLPGEWEKIASELQYAPGEVCAALARLDSLAAVDPEASSDIRAALFVRASHALTAARIEHRRLLGIVNKDGRVRWRDVLEILPKTECVSITLHPRVRLQGNLPSHLPIARIERIKVPQPGILLTTDSGFALRLISDDSMLLDMMVDQLEGVTYATWAEVVAFLKLPRRREIAETTASDLIRSHGEQMIRIADMEKLLSACQLV
jgi:hypothetical protein